MNVFLAQCGGDAGYGQLLMSQLSDKFFGDRPAYRIDYDLIKNLKATLKDTNVDFGPDGVTASQFVGVTVIPSDRGSTGAEQTCPNNLQHIATGPDVLNTRLYAGMQRRFEWQAQRDMGSKSHWLYSSQPPPSNLQGVRPTEREIIEDAIMSPLLSQPSASRRTQCGKRKRSSTPMHYLNQPLRQIVEIIQELLPERTDCCGNSRKLSITTIPRHFPKGVKEDNRILTGLQTWAVLILQTRSILTSSFVFLVSGPFCLHSL